MNQNICTAHLNDVQFLRLYGLSLQRQFLYQQVEKKLIQNLQPINIKPKHILNLGADLTLHKNHRLNLNSYNLYDKLPKTTNVIINKILLDKYKNKSYISHTSSNNYSNNILNGISNAFTKAKNIISKDSDTKIINEDVLFTDDILNIPQQIKPNSIDIIYSNLSLNYYNDLPNILQTWSKVLTNQGLIIFSLLGIGSANNMPFSLPLIDMHDIGDMLVHSRFSNPVVHTQKINLDYKNSNIKAIMQDLHAFGLLFNTNSELKLNNNYTKLASLFSHINSIELEVVYAHAWKVEQKSTKNHNQEQIINIDKLHRKN